MIPDTLPDKVRTLWFGERRKYERQRLEHVRSEGTASETRFKTTALHLKLKYKRGLKLKATGPQTTENEYRHLNYGW